MNPWMMGIGTALGMVKAGLDQQREESDRRVASETARYSPWTGMKPQAIQRMNFMGDVLGGAGAGAAMGQQFNTPAAAAPAAYGGANLGLANMPDYQAIGAMRGAQMPGFQYKSPWFGSM